MKIELIDTHIGNVLAQMEDSGRVVCICLLFSFLTITPVGYNVVALNVPEKIVQAHVNASFTTVFHAPLSTKSMSVFWSITVASQSFGALIGCAFVVPLSSRWGAKQVLTGVNFLLFLSSISYILSYFANLAPLLVLGRFLTGMYTGIGCAMLPLFIQEVAPKHIKGSLSCFMHIAVCLGSSLSAIVSLPFMLGGPHTWWLHLSLPAAFGVASVILGGTVPETPNHLISKGHYTRALQAIKFYYDIGTNDEDEAMREYWELVPQMPPQMSFRDAMSSPKIRWAVFIGAVVSAAQIFSGSMVTISYSTSMFTMVSFLDALVPFLPALGSLVSVLLTLPAIQLVETSGRRPLLLYTLAICVLSDTLFLIFSLLSRNPDDWWASWLFGMSFLIYGVGYNLGVGPIAYFIPPELVPPEAATVALGVAVAINWLSTLFTTLVYYPMQKAMGGWSYLLFIVPSSVFLVFLTKFLPETRLYYEEEGGEQMRTFSQIEALIPYGTIERVRDDSVEDNL